MLNKSNNTRTEFTIILTSEEHQLLYWALRGYIENKQSQIFEANEVTPENDEMHKDMCKHVSELEEIRDNATSLAEKLNLSQYGFLNYFLKI